MSHIRKVWNRFFFQPDTAFNLGVLRFLVFTVGATYFMFKEEAHVPSFFDHWVPISFYQLLSGPVSHGTLEKIRWIWLISSWFAGLGLFYRFLAPLAAIAGVFFMGHEYNFGQVFHSRHLYVMTVLILAFSKADRGFLFWKKGDSEASSSYRWPVRWVQLYVVYVMFITGVEKIYYGGISSWAFSDAFYLRLFLAPEPSFLNKWILEQPLIVSQLFAAFALYVVELSAPIVFINRRATYFMVFFWSMFHVMVTLTLGNHFLFYSQILAYCSFIDWRKHFKKSEVALVFEPTLSRFKMSMVSVSIFLVMSMSVFQLVGGNREDFPFTWYGMFNGGVSNRDLYKYYFEYSAPGQSKINLMNQGNAYNLDYQFSGALQGLKLDFNNSVLVPPGVPQLNSENLAAVKRIMEESSRSILARMRIVPEPGATVVLRYKYWKLFTPEVRNLPKEEVIVLEIPAPAP